MMNLQIQIISTITAFVDFMLLNFLPQFLHFYKNWLWNHKFVWSNPLSYEANILKAMDSFCCVQQISGSNFYNNFIVSRSNRRAELLSRRTLGVAWAVPKTVPTCLAWKRCPGSNVRHSMHVIMSSIERYPISLSPKCVFPLIFMWRKLYQKTGFR